MLWQRPARVGLATFVIAFGVAVLIGVRDRTPPAVAVGVVRADPAAVTQSRGARIVQREAADDNLRVAAERQLTYPDGRVTFIENVDIVVPARDERVDFRLRGNEATVMEEAGALSVVGDVTFESSDGLTGTTAEASYVDNEGIVVMPGAAEFRQGWMQAAGQTARYDRRGGLLYLDPDAVVVLSRGDDDEMQETRITATSAVVAQRDGYMRFTHDVVIDAGAQQMEAASVRAAFDAGQSRLQAIELVGDARILGTTPTPGQLRTMSAPEMTVAYGTGVPEQVTLANGARLELFGDAPAEGATIASRSMDVGLGVGGATFDVIRARDAVVVALPPGDGARQRIESSVLQIGTSVAPTEPGADAGLRARFDDGVEYREVDPGAAGVAAADRVIRARRLDATLDDDLAGMRDARFIGSMAFETADIVGHADQATYDIDAGTFTLITVGPGGQTPRVDDRRGSIQADTIVVHFDGPDLDVTGAVESVLTSTPPDSPDETEPVVKRPQLLSEGPPIYVTADAFTYDSDLALATYSGTARLWQDATEFRGRTLVLDEATGNVSAEGAVQTRSLMLQNDDETGEPVEVTSRGRSDSFAYDDATRRARYTANAELSGDYFDLAADTIDVILHEDARSLDRIVAGGDVVLELENRRIVGETMTYFDADGRYEMTGTPVRIVENVDDGCRETTGRALVFYVTAEAVSVDGQSEVRTESTTGECPEAP